MKLTNENFISRSIRMSYLLGAFGLASFLQIGWLGASVGWTTGAAISIASTLSLKWAVKKYFIPGNADAKKDFARFSVVKLPILIICLAAPIKFAGNDIEFLIGFISGTALTPVVITLKALGIALSGKSIANEGVE